MDGGIANERGRSARGPGDARARVEGLPRARATWRGHRIGGETCPYLGTGARGRLRHVSLVPPPVRSLHALSIGALRLETHLQNGDSTCGFCPGGSCMCTSLCHLREPSAVTTVAAPAMARAGPERAQVPFRARPSPPDPTRAPSYRPEGRPLRPARAPVTFPHATSHLHPRAPAMAPHTARTPSTAHRPHTAPQRLLTWNGS